MEGFFPIILVIVFAAFSLFSRMSKKNEDGEKSKPLIPPNLDPMHPKHYGENKQKKMQTKPVRNQPINEVMNAGTSSSYNSTPYQQKRVELKANERQTVPNNSQMKIGKLTKQNLIQGVIMAEILGAPRSKIPLYSTRSKKLPRY